MKSSEVLNSSVSHQNTPHRKMATADKAQKNKPLILILSKDADTRMLYKSFLEMWDYHVAEAGGIKEVFTLTEYFQPELILMDGSLDFEDNLEMMQKIRSNIFLHNTPLILASGYSQPKIRDLAIENGADEFLVKPLNFDELKANVQNYVEPPAQTEFRGESA